MTRYAAQQWDERYAKADYHYGTNPNDFLRASVAYLKPLMPQGVSSQSASRQEAPQILCIAEGEGRNAVFLAEQGFAVTAVDGSA
ncbi:MAG: hypothetical protein RBT63_05075, partial [Bdellovibrionales bacterium]|nr:hypothetical protein [Bdellovibrionales bacterium]